MLVWQFFACIGMFICTRSRADLACAARLARSEQRSIP